MALKPRADGPRPSPPSPAATAPAPGDVAVALLRPHDRAGHDGLLGGTPHLHAIASETYLAVAGAGRLHTVDRDGPAEHLLRPGSAITCAPGTLSRLVDDDGGLLVVLLVEHVGLPAGGDALVPGPDGPERATGLEVDAARHVAATRAHAALADALAEHDVEPYVALHRAVPDRLAAHLDELGAALADPPRSARARHHLERLALVDAHHLLDAVAGPALGVAPAGPLPCCAALVGAPVDAGAPG